MKTFLATAIVVLGVLSGAADTRYSSLQAANFADGGITAQKATAVVKRATGGRVVSTMPTKDGGFRVRVLTKGGRVKTVKVDRNGSIR